MQKRIREAHSQEDWSLCAALCREALSTVGVDQLDDWFHLKVNLAYSLLGNQSGKREEQVEQSIQVYEEMLAVVDKEQSPAKWDYIQGALGYTYGLRADDDECPDRDDEDRCEDREKSIYHYEQWFSMCAREEDPEIWAATKTQLGVGYVRRMAGWQNVERIEVIEKRREYFLHAIELYNEALAVFTKDEFPEEWKEVTSNIVRLWDALDVFRRKQAAIESGSRQQLNRKRCRRSKR